MSAGSRRSASSPGPTLAIGIVGAGRAGTAVGTALARAGHDIVAVHARSEGSRARAAAAFPKAALVDAPAEAVRGADVVLLGVPDDRIEPVAAQVAAEITGGAAGGAGAPLVAHLSGRWGLAPLAAVRSAGAHRAAMHPIMTLAGTDRDAELLAGATFGVTVDAGDAAGAALANRLVADIGGRAVAIPDDRRTTYHAALVLGANFLATLVATATDLLADAGVDAPAEAVAPLLRASLENVLRAGDPAMTGPVRRGDAGTLAAQRAELARTDPAIAAAYVTLATLTADRLERAGLLDPARAASVRGVLAGPPDGRLTG